MPKNRRSEYHYTECGLDNVYLVGGFSFVDTPSGQGVRIQDIDGLHRVIGTYLVSAKKRLSGKEIRFLRHEISSSQAALALLLGVRELTVARWEKDQVKMPSAAESALRHLYMEHIGENGRFSTLLKRIAELEAEMYKEKLLMTKEGDCMWQAA